MILSVLYPLLAKGRRLQNSSSNASQLQSEITFNGLHNLGGLHTQGIMYVVKALGGITMVTDTKADGRINWVIDLEPLKA